MLKDCLGLRKHLKLSTFYINSIQFCHSKYGLVSKKHSEHFRQCFTSQDCSRVQKPHIHQKQRTAKSAHFVTQSLYTDCAFEDLLQLISA